MSGTAARFRPESVRAFEFVGREYDAEGGRLSLHYRFEPGPAFTEVIEFPGARPLDGTDLAGRLRLLHLLAGISYFKAACPPEIRLDGALDEPTAGFLDRVYRNGLGEFAFRNNRLDLCRRTFFTGSGSPAPTPSSTQSSNRVVLPLGGGKDSLVSADLLAAAGVDFRLISVGSSPLIGAVADALGRTHLRIRRSISPALLELNHRGALNGHVPISAILAGVMLVAGPLYGYDTVIMSNERSAEAANLRLADGFAVNHQYSKTLAFERDFAAVVNRIDPSFRYFSLLRPHSELAITRHFMRHCGDLHRTFSSCNANFRLADAGTAKAHGHWCLACPKCRFVGLMMAPFADPERLERIMGGNPLADPAQETGYRALLELGDHKPFECVGEAGESRAAMGALWDQDDWRGIAMVERFRDGFTAPALRDWLVPSGRHAIPQAFLAAAHALD